MAKRREPSPYSATRSGLIDAFYGEIRKPAAQPVHNVPGLLVEILFQVFATYGGMSLLDMKHFVGSLWRNPPGEQIARLEQARRVLRRHGLRDPRPKAWRYDPDMED